MEDVLVIRRAVDPRVPPFGKLNTPVGNLGLELPPRRARRVANVLNATVGAGGDWTFMAVPTEDSPTSDESDTSDEEMH